MRWRVVTAFAVAAEQGRLGCGYDEAGGYVRSEARRSGEAIRWLIGSGSSRRSAAPRAAPVPTAKSAFSRDCPPRNGSSEPENGSSEPENGSSEPIPSQQGDR